MTILAFAFAESEFFKKYSVKPVNISWISEDQTETINYEALQRILLHEKVEARKIYVITVTGPSKTGKSLMLDYFLKFLYANVSFKKVLSKN